jgi:ATP-dependent DNA helicase RecG
VGLANEITIRHLKTTDTYIEALNEIGIRKIEDLILYLPRAYEDLSQMQKLATAQEGDKVTIRGTVSNLKLVRTRTGKKLVQADFTDTDGTVCKVVWFNQPHIKRMLSDGEDIVLTGKLVRTGKKFTLQSPVFESGNREMLLHSGRIVPVYPQHDVITTRWLREKMALVKNVISDLPETLPEELISGQWLVASGQSKDQNEESKKLMPRNEAIMQLHFPESGELLKQAQDRISFEELFNLQLIALKRKQEWQAESQDRIKIPMNVELIKSFFASLKFTPTDSQRIAIYEILKDLEKPVPMSRLLEGDVGSGKTLVATAVIANVLYYNGQCALMVPTEVLAKQHAANITKLLNKTCVALLTGSTPKKEAQEIKLGLARGTIDVVIGTHSLIQPDVKFKDLRFAVVDEQHRFGVEQRNKLKANGSPHFLSMTATPIPRTLALTAYGDHDLSVLLEKPGNRKSIKTKVVSPKDRRTVELFIDKEIEDGRQAYVICPLITESDELAEVRNVTSEAKRLKEIFPRRNIALLHGKLTPKEKDEIMGEFKEKKSNILVSTSVIEVGIDVPNASIILIEGSERFGLSQLHQLRGRVGRGDHQSHCFLCTTDVAQASSQRLKAMEKFTDGFYLAEVDLKLRGPGELYGTRQSGMPEIRASSLTNPELVVRARRAAELFLDKKEALIIN